MFWVNTFRVFPLIFYFKLLIYCTLLELFWIYMFLYFDSLYFTHVSLLIFLFPGFFQRLWYLLVYFGPIFLDSAKCSLSPPVFALYNFFYSVFYILEPLFYTSVILFYKSTLLRFSFLRAFGLLTLPLFFTLTSPMIFSKQDQLGGTLALGWVMAPPPYSSSFKVKH